jgi:hypothetical protein
MNAALFPIDYPDKEALIGDSTILAVNDCRYGYYITTPCKQLAIQAQSAVASKT